MKRVVKRPEDRRLDIIRAAKNLFQAQEYEKTTMQQVMDHLGIAKGTIYHYFSSKEELLEAVIDDIVQNSLIAMRKIAADASKTALEKIEAMAKVGSVAEDNEFIMAPLHQASNTVLHTRLLAVALMKQAALYAKVIEQGCKEGVFKTAAPLECAEFVLCAVQFLTDVGIYPWTQEELTRRMHAFPLLIEQQLQAPAGSFQFMVQRERR
jgi:AcrR family transcriptional regulator